MAKKKERNKRLDADPTTRLPFFCCFVLLTHTFAHTHTLTWTLASIAHTQGSIVVLWFDNEGQHSGCFFNVFFVDELLSLNFAVFFKNN